MAEAAERRCHRRCLPDGRPGRTKGRRSTKPQRSRKTRRLRSAEARVAVTRLSGITMLCWRCSAPPHSRPPIPRVFSDLCSWNSPDRTIEVPRRFHSRAVRLSNVVGFCRALFGTVSDIFSPPASAKLLLLFPASWHAWPKVKRRAERHAPQPGHRERLRCRLRGRHRIL